VDGLNRLSRSFFERPTDLVAADLVGCGLITIKDGQRTGGRIVETEAYGGVTDLASHAAIYQRSRAAIMAGPAGIAYVYRSYGVHACFNVVARETGGTGAVLIRAIEPIDGIDVMRKRRGVEPIKLLCSGPGRLTQALAVELNDDGRDVVADDTISLVGTENTPVVIATARIGISRDVDRPWRFCDATSPFLSRPLAAEVTAASNVGLSR
jgi:DNA-3-methyladenine glycosylase